jgi:hypothetical protein
MALARLGPQATPIPLEEREIRAPIITRLVGPALVEEEAGAPEQLSRPRSRRRRKLGISSSGGSGLAELPSSDLVERRNTLTSSLVEREADRRDAYLAAAARPGRANDKALTAATSQVGKATAELGSVMGELFERVVASKVGDLSRMEQMQAAAGRSLLGERSGEANAWDAAAATLAVATGDLIAARERLGEEAATRVEGGFFLRSGTVAELSAFRMNRGYQALPSQAEVLPDDIVFLRPRVEDRSGRPSVPFDVLSADEAQALLAGLPTSTPSQGAVPSSAGGAPSARHRSVAQRLRGTLGL